MKIRFWGRIVGAAFTILAAGAFLFALSAPPPASPQAPPPASPEEALYNVHCGICHLEMGPGAMTLARRYGPDRALLAERRDIDPSVVKIVVRSGIANMPPQTRVDISDAELDRVIAYLTRPDSQRHPAAGGQRP